MLSHTLSSLECYVIILCSPLVVITIVLSDGDNWCEGGGVEVAVFYLSYMLIIIYIFCCWIFSAVGGGPVYDEA